jgi:hypothetical protein
MCNTRQNKRFIHRRGKFNLGHISQAQAGEYQCHKKILEFGLPIYHSAHTNDGTGRCHIPEYCKARFQSLTAGQYLHILEGYSSAKDSNRQPRKLTAHGKTKAYLHRFKIIESPECPCGGGNQTVDHIMYDCIKLQREREQLIHNFSNQHSWPVEKCDLVKKHTKHFMQFVNSIDFEKL